MNDFEINLKNIQEQAKTKIEDGALTDAYAADKDKVIDVLNSAVATEIVCMLRYKNNYYMVEGVEGKNVADEFLEHYKEEEMHLDMLSERITQLGGVPDYNPTNLVSKSHAKYSTSEDVKKMIEDNLVAERIAVQIYTEMIQWIGDKDPTTKRMLEDILKMEEEHADDLADLLERI